MKRFGIRCTEDLERGFSDCIIDSVDLVNAKLQGSGKHFFDTADVDRAIIRGKHCWDMFGWALPDEDIAEFEPIWLAGQDEKLKDYDYAFVDWEERDGRPYAAIDGGLSEGAYAWLLCAGAVPVDVNKRRGGCKRAAPLGKIRMCRGARSSAAQTLETRATQVQVS